MSPCRRAVLPISVSIWCRSRGIDAPEKALRDRRHALAPRAHFDAQALRLHTRGNRNVLIEVLVVAETERQLLLLPGRQCCQAEICGSHLGLALDREGR